MKQAPVPPEILDELDRLRASDTVKVIDAMVVYKDSDGGLEAAHLSNLNDDEAADFGALIGGLIGLGFDGEEGAEVGSAVGSAAASAGMDVVEGTADWDVLAEIPADSAAALILLEHHWAVPFRDAVARAGGFRISDGFISPLDLVEIGLLAREHVDLHAMTQPS